MNKTSILEILLVVFLLLMPLMAAYLARRVFKLKKSVELLRIDRNKLLEKQCSEILFRTVKEGEKIIGELLSKPERQMIIAALNMPEYGDAIKDPKTSFQIRKIYRDLREKIKESLKD